MPVRSGSRDRRRAASSASIRARAATGATMAMSSMSSIRTRTIGRSPEMPCAQSAAGPPPPRRMASDDGRSRRIGVEHVARETLKQARLVGIDAEMAQLHLRLGPRQRGRALEGSWRRDACRRGPAHRRGTMRRPSRRRCAPSRPAATRTRRRSAKTGSRTVPTVLESGRPSITAIGARASRPRPRKRARSVSISGSPTVSPSTTARCAAQISGSAGRPAAPRRQDGADLGVDIRFARRAWRRPGAPRRRRAAPARARRRR